ncbi:MAG: hypothetical protein JW757_02705 [Anaerolineales bacterium]|nr:hypothetical protein [Anaerolineales bacterium]
MRTWKLHRDDPLCLTLAADARLADLDYGNDQIWEVTLGSGEPSGISLQTTYGLRARSMRIFPQFVEAHTAISDPADFEEPPEIHQFASNYLNIKFSPFFGIEVNLEYWVPDGQTIAGRIWVKNTSDLDRDLRVELTAILNPNAEGRPLIPRIVESTHVLQGLTENLHPVLFITGGARGEASPHPHLYHDLNLKPGSFRRFTWVLASLQENEESFRHARLTAAQNWDAQISRIQMLAAQEVHIYTGEPDWDTALAMAQKTAALLRFSPNQHLPYHSFVATRLPDQGYSSQGSGIEYNHLWDGQTPLETWYLSQFLLPSNIEAAKGLLDNFLSHQQPDGFIDHKLGLGGQRSNLTAAPFLVSIAWRIYQHTHDLEYLKRVYHPLLNHLQTWFNDDNDRDGDGIPEWPNLLQTGYDENPAFSRWQPWSSGNDIQLVECPDLCAYLLREISLLKKIAGLIGFKKSTLALEALADNLQTAVQNAWNGRRATFQYWDRESHQTPRGETLKTRIGSGEMLLDLVFGLPTRLQIRLESKELSSSKIEISIHGTLANGQHRVEKITSGNLTWVQDTSVVTLESLYSEVEHLYIQGLSDEGKVSLQIVDLYQEDHTLLTPIWAGIPTDRQLKQIIKRKLSDKNAYGRKSGIPAIPKPKPKAALDEGMQVWLPWNAMVAEGLLAYGKIQLAADLFTRIMSAAIRNLKQEGSFRAHYHAEQGTPTGQRNHLIGLPPVGLFLEILGVRLMTDGQIKLMHKNPFPWDVKLSFRGTSITCTQQEVILKFPHGETITANEHIPCLVENNLIKVENEQ